jgi:hypothetical protein
MYAGDTDIGTGQSLQHIGENRARSTRTSVDPIIHEVYENFGKGIAICRDTWAVRHSASTTNST